MATEEFKHVTKELLDNYLELRKTMQDKGYENISFSFKEYLDHYISYVEHVGIDFENYEDEEQPEETEEDLPEVHPSYNAS